jgi:lysophospholipase L1-like esterase
MKKLLSIFLVCFATVAFAQEPLVLQKELQQDRLHPNAAGYRKMWQYAAKIIKDEYTK